MAALYRVDWFFSTAQPANVGRDAFYGWTESWGLTANSVDDAIATAGNLDAASWINLRRSFLASVYRIGFVRCTAVADATGAPIPPIVKIKTLYGITGVVGSVAKPEKPAQVQCGVLVNFTVLPTDTDTRTHQRRVFFRGLGSKMINGNVLDPTSESYTSMLLFLNLVGRHETGTAIPPLLPPRVYKMIYQNSTLAAAGVPITAMDITQVAPPVSLRTVSVTSALVAGRGQRVRTYGVERAGGMDRYLNRKWTVLSPAIPGVVLQLGKTKGQLVPTAAPAGTAVVPIDFSHAFIQRINLSSAPPDQYSIIRLGSKKTGHPPSLVRGRRSVQGVK